MNATSRALLNIRETARTLPQSVGQHHRTTLVEAAHTLDRVLTSYGEVLAPFLKFGEMYEAKPINPARMCTDDMLIYGIHHGTEWAAELTLGDFRRAFRVEDLAPEEWSLAPELATVLRQILADLPANKDWLDPASEQTARAVLAKAEKRGHL